MHILFLTHYFPPEVNAPATRSFAHIKQWINKGHQVTVITNHPNHPNGVLYEGYANKVYTVEDIEGIKVIRVKTLLTPNSGIFLRICNFFQFFILSIFTSFYVHGCEVVVATTPQLFCGLAGMFICKIKHVNFILEVRDIWPDSLLAVGIAQKGILIKLLKKIENILYFSASAIIVVTHGLYDYIKNKEYPSERLFIIPNGADWQDSVSISNTPIIKTNSFTVGYVGTLGMAHDIITVLRVAQILKEEHNIKFLIVGDGSEKKTLVRSATGMGLTNVEFIDQQPKSVIPSIIDTIDIGLVILKNHPLFKGALPSKMFEYLILEKPVVVSVPNGETTQFVIKHNCGLVAEPENPQSLAEKILTLIKDEKLRLEMGSNGRRVTQEKYNRKELAQKMLEVIIQNSKRFPG